MYHDNLPVLNAKTLKIGNFGVLWRDLSNWDQLQRIIHHLTCPESTTNNHANKKSPDLTAIVRAFFLLNKKDDFLMMFF